MVDASVRRSLQGSSSGLVYNPPHGAKLRGGLGGLRNEPNLGARLLIRFGWGGFGNPRCGQLRALHGGFYELPGGLQALVAADRIDAALETIEHPVGEVEDAAVGMIVRGVIALRAVGFVTGFSSV
jgi:hypothetical protein